MLPNYFYNYYYYVAVIAFDNTKLLFMIIDYTFLSVFNVTLLVYE